MQQEENAPNHEGQSRTVTISIAGSPEDQQKGRFGLLEGTIAQLSAIGDYFVPLLTGGFRESNIETDGENKDTRTCVYMGHLRGMPVDVVQRLALFMQSDGSRAPSQADAFVFWGALAFCRANVCLLAQCSRVIVGALGFREGPDGWTQPECPVPLMALGVYVWHAVGQWEQCFNPFTVMGITSEPGSDGVHVYGPALLWRLVPFRNRTVPAPRPQHHKTHEERTATTMYETSLDLEYDHRARDYMHHRRALFGAARAIASGEGTFARVIGTLARQADVSLARVLAHAVCMWARLLLPVDQALGLGATLVRPLTDKYVPLLREQRCDNATRDHWSDGAQSDRTGDCPVPNENPPDSAPAFVRDMNEFRDALADVCPRFAHLLCGSRDGSTPSLLDGRGDLVMAGGAVVYAMQSSTLRRWLPGSDIDLWILGDTQEVRIAIFQRVVRAISGALPECVPVVHGATVTFTLPVQDAAQDAHQEVLQLIFTDHSNPVQLVCDFDMTHVCAYYDGRDLWATWDCVASVATRHTEAMPGMTPRSDRAPKALAKGFVCTGILNDSGSDREDQCLITTMTTTTTTAVIEQDVHGRHHRIPHTRCATFDSIETLLERFEYKPMSCEGYRRLSDWHRGERTDTVGRASLADGGGTRSLAERSSTVSHNEEGQYVCAACKSRDPNHDVCVYKHSPGPHRYTTSWGARLRHPWTLRTPPLVVIDFNCPDCIGRTFQSQYGHGHNAASTCAASCASDDGDGGREQPVHACDRNMTMSDCFARDPSLSSTSEVHHSRMISLELTPSAAMRTGHFMDHERGRFRAFVQSAEHEASTTAWNAVKLYAGLDNDRVHCFSVIVTPGNPADVPPYEVARMRVTQDAHIIDGIRFGDPLPVNALYEPGAIVQGTVHFGRIAFASDNRMVSVARLASARVYPPTFLQDAAYIARALDVRAHPVRRR